MCLKINFERMCLKIDLGKHVYEDTFRNACVWRYIWESMCLKIHLGKHVSEDTLGNACV
jgi:hypothetical protein